MSPHGYEPFRMPVWTCLLLLLPLTERWSQWRWSAKYISHCPRRSTMIPWSCAFVLLPHSPSEFSSYCSLLNLWGSLSPYLNHPLAMWFLWLVLCQCSYFLSCALETPLPLARKLFSYPFFALWSRLFSLCLGQPGILPPHESAKDVPLNIRVTKTVILTQGKIRFLWMDWNGSPGIWPTWEMISHALSPVQAFYSCAFGILQ